MIRLAIGDKMRDTLPACELSIEGMIIDELLRLDIRPDWRPGGMPLDPEDFRAGRKTVIRFAVRMGVDK